MNSLDWQPLASLGMAPLAMVIWVGLLVGWASARTGLGAGLALPALAWLGCPLPGAMLAVKLPVMLADLASCCALAGPAGPRRQRTPALSIKAILSWARMAQAPRIALIALMAGALAAGAVKLAWAPPCASAATRTSTCTSMSPSALARLAPSPAWAAGSIVLILLALGVSGRRAARRPTRMPAHTPAHTPVHTYPPQASTPQTSWSQAWLWGLYIGACGMAAAWLWRCWHRTGSASSLAESEARSAQLRAGANLGAVLALLLCGERPSSEIALLAASQALGAWWAARAQRASAGQQGGLNLGL